MGKVIAIVIGLTFAIPILGLLVKAVFFPVHTAQKEIDTAYEVVDKTLDSDNAIYNYEWFKRQKESIDATNRKLEIAVRAYGDFDEAAGERKDWTFEDKTESSRLHAVAQGIEGQLKDMIGEYNARTKMANRNMFQEGLLPDYIDATTFIFKK